jgi:D-alanyl-lipoteichoic acid acyltransferase DltB (MBOAT superfamily)
VLEVRNEVVPRPGPAEYLGYAFFLPTMLVGPISPYSVHHGSFANPDRSGMPAGRCLFRIVVGGTKCEFLGNLANQVSYSGLFLDGKPHGAGDLLVAMVFYYLYLYLNFSGFCDIAIGVAGLIGIRVRENFNNPFAAPSIREFWNRWHITLSEYVRDVIFSPVTRAMMRRRRNANLAIACGIFAAFTVVGVWHGPEWRFLVFGLIQAAGLIVNHYYTVWMKRRLGPQRYRRYDDDRWVNMAGRVATSTFYAASLFFFANDNYVLGSVLHGLGLRAG